MGAGLVCLLLGCSGGGGGGGGGACPDGSETCPCYGNQTCDGTLTCASNVCVSLGSGGTSGSGGSGGASGASGGAGQSGGAGTAGTGGSAQLIGQLSGWQTTTNLPTAPSTQAQFGCAFAAHGFVFYVNYRYGLQSSVTWAIYAAPQNADGTLGSWSPIGGPSTFQAKSSIDGLQCAYGNGFLFLLESDPDNQFVIRSAPVSSSGTIGAFAIAHAIAPGQLFPNPFGQAPGLLVHNGHLIISALTLGSSAPSGYASVKGAIASDGTVGSLGLGSDYGYIAWQNPAVTSFAGPTVGWGSFIYKMGTDDSVGVWFMDEQLGEWKDTTAIPASTIAPRAVVWEGFAFLMGDAERVYVSALHPDGVVGNWSQTSPLPQAVLAGAAVAANGYVYYLGGLAAGSNQVSTVYYAKVE